jgi:trk system potassium uptake protein TrkH
MLDRDSKNKQNQLANKSMAFTINHKIIFKVISRILIILSVFLISAMFVGLIYSENILPFVITTAISISAGVLLHLFSKNQDYEASIHRKEAYLTVSLAWLAISLVGSLPYSISGSIPVFTNAFFESVSGFTTTGASILTDIEVLPKSVLYWRSLTHWIGGIGIIVLVILIMPKLQVGGYHLFSMESSLQQKIQPKTKEVGKRLVMIYISLTFLEIVLLLLGGMNLFESTCHAFGTVATGGFSPKNTSIANYSPYIQYVVMLFMLLSGTSFIIHYYFAKKELGKIKMNEEFWFYLLVVFLVGSAVTSILFFQMGKPFEESFREGFFQVISIITCTGFATADYLLWPVIGWSILFFAMFLGGSTGSTAGGIKMARHLIILKNIKKCFRKMVSPNAIVQVHLNKNTLNDNSINTIQSFIALYLMVFIVGSFLLIVMGLDGKTAASSVATCMAG